MNVDGNVHFVGTQGVGKSTVLRALLFFYNANQQKLGIPVNKKSFVDFYFPYQNSYIIYEVNRETGMYCLLVFKSQGRVCFRFIDGSYNRDHFIGSEGNIHETWDKIKLAFGTDTYYTRKIDRYEDYRNIIYGNSQGLGAEFKKYALLESRQYQNIPRAIQHVFLNYKVESEFIKDTIIKSLNEEEINIDLSNYSSHLKNFDTQLNDIKRWTEKTKGGEIIVRKQAETVITTFSAIKYNESEKKQLAGELIWQLCEIEKQQPKVVEKLGKEEKKQNLLTERIANLERNFQGKKEKITAEINVYEAKLKEAKTKSEEYAELKIENVIKRVLKKSDWETETEELTKQKELLESNFADIKQKYEAQMTQLTNQLSTFENLKQNEINTANKNLLHFKEELTKEYEKLFEEVRKQHQEELLLAKNFSEEKKTVIRNLQILKATTEHKRFYETEIENLKTNKNALIEKIRIANSETTQLNGEIETIKKQWELEKEKFETTSNNQKEKVVEQIGNLNNKITAIDEKVENSKDSLYGWLNNEYPNWEKTIGKVIDEESILFKSGLSPERTSKSDLSFYGIKIDLKEISKSVKTVADYEKEKTKFIKEIESLQKDILGISEQLNVELENLRKKHQPKINKCKETIRSNGYIVEQSTAKLDETKVSLEELTNKAAADKKAELEKIQINFERTSSEALDADKAMKVVEDGIKKQIESKKKEKEKKVDVEQANVSNSIAEINLALKNKGAETKKKIDELKSKQKKELDSKGADTEKILGFEKRIAELKAELFFIEANRDKVSDYNKDKRELFDKVESFKNQKVGFENQLGTELTKHGQQKKKLNDELDLLITEIKTITQQVEIIHEDLLEYETFKMTDCFKSIPEFLEVPAEEYKTEKRCKYLISELNAKYYNGIKKYTDLQEAVNKFNGNFSSENIFKFKTNLVEQSEYFQFSEELREFLEEDKISLFEKRVNELFADIIRQVGKETTELLSKEGEIEGVIKEINKDFEKRIFTGVIKSIELRVVSSENKIVHLLLEIKKFNDENIDDIGASNLFSPNEQVRETKNKKAIGLLTQLIKEMGDYKHRQITLSDSFELEFKVVENDNDTNWVQSLANVGSNGTDVLVKAMINIMLLNVFKDGATKNRFSDFRLHCMVDEIGTLHIENVRGLLKFANDRNIYILNGSPQSLDALAYKHTYKFAKQSDKKSGKPVTIINRLITNNRKLA